VLSNRTVASIFVRQLHFQYLTILSIPNKYQQFQVAAFCVLDCSVQLILLAGTDSDDFLCVSVHNGDVCSVIDQEEWVEGIGVAKEVKHVVVTILTRISNLLDNFLFLSINCNGRSATPASI
jgi:hypothetical protein